MALSKHGSITVATAYERFDAVAADAITTFCAEYPVEATALGNHDFDSRLGDPSQAAVRRRLTELAELKQRLDHQRGLDTDTAVDRDVLCNAIERELCALTDADGPGWDPLQHDPGRALVPLLEQNFAPLPDRLASVAGRLRDVPDYLDAARQRLIHPPKLHLQQAIAQTRKTHALITAEIPRLAEQAGLQAQFAGSIERAADAVQGHQAWLRDLLPNAGRDCRLGEGRYATKLALTHSTSWRPAALLSQAYADLVRVEGELAALASARHGRTVGPAEIAAEYDRLAADAPSGDLLGECLDALAASAAFVEEHELLTLLDDPLQVAATPQVDLAVSVACCQAVGPLETAPLPTRFAVSPNPTGWPEERTRSFHSKYNTHMLHNLTVHEGIPGHVTQTAHARRCPSPVRSVFGGRTFIEGWAVYAEQLMADSGYRSEVSAEATAAIRMQQLKMQLRMVLNAILDISFHAGDLTEAGALELMTGHGFYDEAEAAFRWRRVQLTSTQLSTYYVGYLEVRAVLAALRAAHPEWTDREVHDTLLGHGSPPASQLRRLLGLPSTTASAFG